MSRGAETRLVSADMVAFLTAMGKNDMTVCFKDVVFEAECFTLDCEQLPATIGRSENATVRLVTDHWASRKHCTIEISDGKLVVRDLDSVNGTFVNGQRIHQACLERGDKLEIGLHAFQVTDVAIADYQSANTDNPLAAVTV